MPIAYIFFAAHEDLCERTIIPTNFIKSQQISKSDAARNSLVSLLRSLYNNYILSDLVYSDQPRIPKIIHQIWMGSPFPEKYKKWQATWISLHPGWIYMLWDDEKLRNFPMYNKSAFEQARNYGVKADIARLEILYQLGGLYIDTDMECLRPFDVFHHCLDFYACLESNAERIGNAVIGSFPGNPIVAECIDQLSKSDTMVTGFWEIINTTGPGLLTRAVVKVMASDPHRCVVFPSSYFYPSWKLRPETYAVHYWHGAWFK